MTAPSGGGWTGCASSFSAPSSGPQGAQAHRSELYETSSGHETMGNDSQLRAGEIKKVLLSEIENYGEELHAEETGEVLEVKDGIARIYGLTRAMASEMLEVTASETSV